MRTPESFTATFIVRLPLPRGTTRIEAETALRDQIMEGGLWQGCPDVYVREDRQLTPEAEVHRAEMLRERDARAAEAYDQRVAARARKAARRAKAKEAQADAAKAKAEYEAIVARRRAGKTKD
jgi:hypothetical protein